MVPLDWLSPTQTQQIGLRVSLCMDFYTKIHGLWYLLYGKKWNTLTFHILLYVCNACPSSMQ